MNRAELEKRTAQFARDVFALCKCARGKDGGRDPANQLQDAASSVGANYRSSGRSRSHAEFTAKIGIANEEADEAVYWLEFMGSTQLVERQALDQLLGEAKELRAILAASYATARSSPRNNKKRR